MKFRFLVLLLASIILLFIPNQDLRAKLFWLQGKGGLGIPIINTATISSIAISNPNFTAQAGNSNSTIGTLSTTATGGVFSGNYTLASSGSGCPGTDNALFLATGANNSVITIGNSDVPTGRLYNLCVKGTDPTFANSPFFQVIVLTGTNVGACACNPGGVTNICPDNLNPSAGSIIHVTTVCNPPTGNFIGWTSPFSGANSRLFSAPLGGASTATVAIQVPNVASDRPLQWRAYTSSDNNTNGDGAISVTGQTITVPASLTQVLGNSLPADVGADPFIPAHIITVCPSGCDYAHVEDAISFVQSINPAWDNVEITIDAADYPFPNSNAFPVNAFNFPNMPAHLWFKGIIGRSGTNGTIYPHFFDAPGANPNTSELINTAGPTAIWFDNFELGPFDFWMVVPNAQQNTFRNVYFHDGGQGLINSDGPHHNVTIINSHFARNGNGSGPDHNIYQGAGDNTDQLNITNTILEQVNVGHNIKTRAFTTILSCDKDLINEDFSYNGSEMVDCSEGRNCQVHNSLLVNAGGSPGWNQDNSFDGIRFGADTEFTTLTNNQIDLQGSTLISDNDASFFQFINLHRAITPSPPYPAGNISPNTFVFFSSNQMNAFGRGFQYNGQLADGNDISSTIVTGLTDHGSSANAINLGTIGVQNFVYSDRASAGLPAIGSYPKGYTDPAFAAMPAACTDFVGRVKIPAN